MIIKLLINRIGGNIIQHCKKRRIMNLPQFLMLTLLGSTTILYLIVKAAFSYWKYRGILHAKPTIPWGHMKGVGSKLHIADVLRRFYTLYSGQAPFIGFYAWLKPMVLMLDLDAIHQILVVNADHFQDRGLYNNVSTDPLTQNLIQLDGTAWKELHDKTKHLWLKDVILQTYPALMKVRKNFELTLKKEIRRETLTDVSGLIDQFNVDVIGSLAYGLSDDFEENIAFRVFALNYINIKSRRYFLNIRMPNSLAFICPNWARWMHYRLFQPESTQHCLNMLRGKLKERAKLKSVPYDFLRIWSENRFPCKMNDNEIAGQAFSFLWAGLEACNSIVALCLYELAFQPKLQEKARKEVRKVLKKYENCMRHEMLNELVYLKQLLNETLRKYPPYPFLLRLTTKDYDLPNTVFALKRGNHVIIPVAAIHNDPDYYENPYQFDPEHFHSSKVKTRPVCAFLPFGLGSRSCIAQHFAMQQLLVGLMTLLNMYRFAPCQNTIAPLRFDNSKFFLEPKPRIQLLMKPT
ncbi:putative cytochrome P450 6u1 isoform 1-T5 [Glossina fuscipes fuscipes]